MNTRVKDKQSYFVVKDAVVARSGIYLYTYEEILARGIKPKTVKAIYKEYRPPAVIVEAQSLFELAPVVKEHVEDVINSDNFAENTGGVLGGPITTVPIVGTEDIGLKGRLAFYTKDLYDYYQDGNKETSPDYDTEYEAVKNPDEVGYDFIVTKITAVNNVAVTKRGRGGPAVRVQDSAPEVNVIDTMLGRKGEMSKFLNLLGLGKFSATVKDSLDRAQKLGADGRVKECDIVVGRLTKNLPESEARETLIGAVKDSFDYPAEVIGKWGEASKELDTLYANCKDSSMEKKPAGEKSDEDDEDDEGKKESKNKDSAPVVDTDAAIARVTDTASALVDEKFKALREELPGIITEGIKSALSLGEGDAGSKGGKGKSRNVDSASDAEDITFEITGAFGR